MIRIIHNNPDRLRRPTRRIYVSQGDRTPLLLRPLTWTDVHVGEVRPKQVADELAKKRRQAKKRGKEKAKFEACYVRADNW